MPTTEVIALLSLILALSAYVATMRLRLIDQIKADSDPKRKNKLKRVSRCLTLADAPLIVSGVLLFFHGFWDNTLGLWISDPEAPGWMLPWSICVFTFAIVVLVGHHAGA
jgi:hypothetical protein